MQEAIKAAEALRRQNKQAIRPFVPTAMRSEPALELPPLELTGPKGVLVHPFGTKEPEKDQALGSTQSLRLTTGDETG